MYRLALGYIYQLLRNIKLKNIFTKNFKQYNVFYFIAK